VTLKTTNLRREVQSMCQRLMYSGNEAQGGINLVNPQVLQTLLLQQFEVVCHKRASKSRSLGVNI
jgi:hypothetical protein